MTSQVTNKHFEGRLRDNTEEQHEYTTVLKKEVFLKFFSILKQPGYALMKVTNNAKMEMEFTWDKSPSITVVQEVASRVIWILPGTEAVNSNIRPKKKFQEYVQFSPFNTQFVNN